MHVHVHVHVHVRVQGDERKKNLNAHIHTHMYIHVHCTLYTERMLTLSGHPVQPPLRDMRRGPLPACLGSTDTHEAAGHMHSDLHHLHRARYMYVYAQECMSRHVP